MIYGAWVEQELDFYRKELERLAQECEPGSELYNSRRASIVQCMKMLEELAEPVQEDSA